jgi:DNA-binding NtrC family response regulator
MQAKIADELEQLCRQKRIRCVVVEDDSVLRTLIARVLRDFGMEVFDTENGRDAIVAHYQIPFDLLILSWFNNNFSGERILGTMCELCPQMPKVIIMPGQEAVSMHSPVPVAGFLFKPFDIEKLANVVMDALEAENA